MLFAAHPVRLPDGSLTIPDCDWEMGQHPTLLAAKWGIQEKFGSDLSKVSVLDLGALEGGFTVEFARLGMEAVGLEVRESNIKKCEYLSSKLALPKLSFVRDDCWNLEKYGHFDVIFCSGLLYHLQDPVRYLGLLAKQCSLLILDTHYAYEISSSKFTLSEIDTHEGYPGRWYTEYPPGTTTKDESASWTSWENARSFWPLKNSLLRAVSEVGFRIIDSSINGRHEMERMTVIADVP